MRFHDKRLRGEAMVKTMLWSKGHGDNNLVDIYIGDFTEETETVVKTKVGAYSKAVIDDFNLASGFDLISEEHLNILDFHKLKASGAKL